MSAGGAPAGPDAADVRRTTDPHEMLTRCAGLLAAEPVWTNLVATVAATEAARRDRRSTYLWVERSGQVTALAMATPSQPVCVSDCSAVDAHALADALHRAADDVAGVTGPVLAAEEVARRWCGLTGATIRPGMRQGVHVCDEVVPPTGVRGGPRLATAEDLDLVLAWTTDFSTEAGLGPVRVEAVAWSVADDRVWLWQVPAGAGAGERPVSLVMVRSARGMTRVAPVFTPSPDRRHGYASALTAHVTKRALAAGYRAMLLTDLANATANRIYSTIGYRRVGDAVVLWLDPPTDSAG